MTHSLRKLTLTTHVTSSVGWIGAAIAYLIIAIAALSNQDDQIVRGAYLALEPIGWYALVPMAFLSLVTGVLISLGTPWGLIRHYWVLFKLLLTIFATLVLLNHMPSVSLLAGTAAETNTIYRNALKSEILHAGGGVLVLLVTTILAVYKPAGLTFLVQRIKTDGASITETPRWVKILGIIFLVVVLLFIIGHVTDHSPGIH